MKGTLTFRSGFFRRNGSILREIAPLLPWTFSDPGTPPTLGVFQLADLPGSCTNGHSRAATSFARFTRAGSWDR
jgi:hypothetical protein